MGGEEGGRESEIKRGSKEIEERSRRWQRRLGEREIEICEGMVGKEDSLWWLM